MPRINYRDVVAAGTPLSNFSKFFVHPVFDRLLWVLVNHCPVHPNWLTVLGAALAVVAAVFYARGDTAGLIVGAAFYYCAFGCDTIDGSMAKLTGRTSKLGAWLDSILDYLRSCVVTIALAIGVYRLIGSVHALYAGLVLVAVNTFYLHVANVAEKYTGERPLGMLRSSRNRFVALIKRLGFVPSPFTLLDMEALYLIVGPLVGYPFEGMLAAIWVGGLSRAVVVVVVGRRLLRQDRANRCAPGQDS